MGAVDARLGTGVAFAYAGLLVAACFVWLGRGHAPMAVSPWELGVLLALAVAYGRLPVETSPRTYHTLEGPTIVFAALVGGPIAGALVGASAHFASRGVWRRNLCFAGLVGMQGFVAGLVGDHWRAGAITPVVAVLGAGAIAIGVRRLGVWLVRFVRRGQERHADVKDMLVDVGEMLLTVPILLMAIRSEAVLATAAMVTLLGAFGVAWLGWSRLRQLAVEHQHLALTDFVTGAPNRVAYEEAVQREHARVVRGDGLAGICMIDLDLFKDVNDVYGHPVGDIVLRAVAHRLADAVRPGDLLARWGGEEFSLLAPGITGLADLEELGERVRAAVASAPFPTRAGDVSVTVSVGGALLNGTVGPDAALARADEALYRAKWDRDSVVVLEPREEQVREGLAAPAAVAG